MRIEYFKETDSAIIQFSDEPSVSTKIFSNDMNIDVGASGNIVGLEIHQNAGILLSLRKLQLAGISQGQVELKS